MIGSAIVYLYGVAVLNSLHPFFIANHSDNGGTSYDIQTNIFKPQVYEGLHPNEPVHIHQNFDIANY